MLGIGLVVLLVLVTAFFVAVEFGLVSVRKTRIEQLAAEGKAGAVQVKRAVENLNHYLAAAQVGITMATLGLGTLGEPVVAQLFVPMLEQLLPHQLVEGFVSVHGVALIIALLLVTIIELIVGENVPKIASIQRAEAATLLLIRPMNFFMFVFKPFIWVVNYLTLLLLRLLGLSAYSEHGNVYSVEELEMLVVSSRQAGVLDRHEEVILRRVFDFGDLAARQVMLPRTEIVAIPVTATLQEVIQTFTEHKHTRLPVYEGTVDSLVGILHVNDVFALLAESGASTVASLVPTQDGGTADGRGEQFDVRAIMRPIISVPETLDVGEILSLMQREGVQMVAVIDEYGGTAGILTLEDIVEEIVGELRDEFETTEANSGIVTTPEGTLVDGLVAIDDLNEALGLSIAGESDTVGGYVFELLGRKPELGDEVTSEGYVFRVEALDNLRIAKVRLVAARKGHDTAQGPGNEE